MSVVQSIKFRNMVRSEVEELVSWAAREGWNPGLHDADLFWATDPEAFIAADLHGEMIGGGAITSYDGKYGFMGFFIVRPKYRGQGLGDVLWHFRREKLLERLQPNATIGLDGVFEMQSYYAKGGFVFSHRNIRHRNVITDTPQSAVNNDGNIVSLAEVPFDQLMAYDRACFPAARPTFLRAWISQPDALALGYLHDGKLAGYGVVRRCGDGCKVGPLFAENSIVAESLYVHLAEFAIGEPLYLDAPENNPAAVNLAAKYKMSEVFGTARMYLGQPPSIAHERIFGVTTFELG
jgi:GNAT superfamily N-acetyltransferase